jgi:anti-sigma factor RsiW
MMDCKHLERYLSRYLEGELEKEQKDKVEEHLACCPSCAGRLKKLEAITAILRRLKPIQPRGDFAALLSEKVQREIGYW